MVLTVILVFLLTVAILLGCLAAAIGLAWAIGRVTGWLQGRHLPDFRERKREGKGRSE